MLDPKSDFAGTVGDRARHSVLLVLLLLTDFAFIGINVCRFTIGHPTSPLWFIERDRTFPELFQYMKWAWLILLILGVTLRHSAPSLLSWAALFAYALADDYYKLHEGFGDAWTHGKVYAGMTFGLRPRDLGSLAYLALVGVPFLGLLGGSVLLSSREHREIHRGFFVMLAGLVVFAVIVDTLHQMAAGTPLYGALGVVEDGGEMVVLSLGVGYAEQWLATAANSGPTHLA